MAETRFSGLRPGSIIGILGGGQLGRMLVLAAARLGFHCHVYCPDKDSPAFDVVRRISESSYDDQTALAGFADAVDVITYEFENVPVECASFLAARKPVRPDPKILAITQDRLAEKLFVISLGFATAPFAEVNSTDDLAKGLRTTGRPAVLKTRRFGYDGKGQAKIAETTDLAAAFRDVGSEPSIVEGFVRFEREISVIAARDHDGHIECFDVTENEHGEHILRRSLVPAAITPEVAAEARHIAGRIAQALGYIGVLAVEMFVIAQGGKHKVLVNEIAPRVHNSGHWTIDGASVSQFEQHVRAVAGWPLATPVRRGRIEMFNLIGSEAEDFAQWLDQADTAVHLYGKSRWRPGRKMGHVTRVFPKK